MIYMLNCNRVVDLDEEVNQVRNGVTEMIMMMTMALIKVVYMRYSFMFADTDTF